MNKCTIVLLACISIALTANCQITKGNWMLGGSIKFSSARYNSDAGSKNAATDVEATPDVGYFIADKLAVGLNTSISRQSFKGIGTSVSSSYTDFSAGPFIRYYLLPTEQQLNIVTEGSYLLGFAGGNGPGRKPFKSTYAFAAGPVVYFNTSVGLEFLIGYSSYKYAGFNGRDNIFQLGLGLQFHLEKEK